MMTGLHDPEREQRALTVLRRTSRRWHRARLVRQRSRRCLPATPGRSGRLRPARLSRLCRRSSNRRPAACCAATTRAGSPPTVDHLVERGLPAADLRRAGQRLVGRAPPRQPRPRRSRAPSASGAMRFLDSRAERLARCVDGGGRDSPPTHRTRSICYDDKLALALLDALRSTRLDVYRDDLALVGFDGIPAARQSRPRLTTVDVPSVEIGRRAVGDADRRRHGTARRIAAVRRSCPSTWSSARARRSGPPGPPGRA